MTNSCTSHVCYSGDIAHTNWVNQKTVSGAHISTLTWTYDHTNANYAKTTNPDHGGTYGKIYYKNADRTSVSVGTYRRTGDDLSDQSVRVLTGLEQRADASNKLIAAAALGSVAVGATGGTFVGLTGLSTGGVTTIATGGGAIGIEGLTADQVALVSRWGRAGLQPGDWVMNGGTGIVTYLMSGKWQPGLGNIFAEFSSGQNFIVPKAAIQNPDWIENGLGWIKALVGQRIFTP